MSAPSHLTRQARARKALAVAFNREHHPNEEHPYDDQSPYMQTARERWTALYRATRVLSPRSAAWSALRARSYSSSQLCHASAQLRESFDPLAWGRRPRHVSILSSPCLRAALAKHLHFLIQDVRVGVLRSGAGSGPGAGLIEAQVPNPSPARTPFRPAHVWRRMVCGVDDQGFWAIRVPGTITTTADALRWITPYAVRRYLKAGFLAPGEVDRPGLVKDRRLTHIVRQGDLFALGVERWNNALRPALRSHRIVMEQPARDGHRAHRPLALDGQYQWTFHAGRSYAPSGPAAAD